MVSKLKFKSALAALLLSQLVISTGLAPRSIAQTRTLPPAAKSCDTITDSQAKEICRLAVQAAWYQGKNSVQCRSETVYSGSGSAKPEDPAAAALGLDLPVLGGRLAQ